MPCACMITFKSDPQPEIKCNLISLQQTTELPSEADKSSPKGSLFVYLFLSNHQKIKIFINTTARTWYMFQWTAVTSRFILHTEFYILELYLHEYNGGIRLRTDKGNKKLRKNYPFRKGLDFVPTSVCKCFCLLIISPLCLLTTTIKCSATWTQIRFTFWPGNMQCNLLLCSRS